MQSRERILNSIKGLDVDRIPWSPFLAYYWDFLPKHVRVKGQMQYMMDIDADPLYRGSHILAKPIYNNCTITDHTKGETKTTTYETKVGNLTSIHTYSPAGNTWYLTKHPVSSKDEFNTLAYIYENISFEDNIAIFEQDKKAIGNNGLYMPLIGVSSKTAFQSLIEHWCGTVDLTYATFDYPEVMEHCLAIMQQKDRETVDIAVKSSAESLLFFEDTSTTNINPQMFSKYIKPEIDEWGDILHRNDKLLVHHACGHLTGVMDQIAASNIDVLESISPPPTGNIELVDARKILPYNMAIIGGIEPTKLANKNLTELEIYVEGIINDMKGTRFVLANSDSCPPEVAEEKLIMISDMMKKL